jgi:tRNA(Ile)-lysidine synthetase-like protein
MVVALSGGGDSVSLAVALESIGCGCVEYVWVDHSLRGTEASADERRVVEKLAERTGRPLIVRTITPGEIRETARRSGQSIEHVARQFRYRELIDAARSIRRTRSTAVFVVTAHHQDDQAENTLLRIAGGHSPLESIAIPRLRELDPGPPPITLYRPALGIPGSELRKWGNQTGVSWVEDESNVDLSFRRNAIRHTVVPPLDDAIPGGSGALARFAEAVDRSRTALEALIPTAAWGVTRGDLPTACDLDLECLLSLPEPAREIVLRDAIYRVASRERVDTGIIREALRRLGLSAGMEETLSELPIVIDAPAQGLSIRLRDGALRVSRDIVPKGQSGYLFTIYDGLTVRLDSKTGRPVPEGTVTPAIVVTFEAASRPAVMRGRRSGDEIVMADKIRSAGDAGRRLRAEPSGFPWPAVVEDDAGVAVFIWRNAVAVRDGGPWRVHREDDPLQRETTVRIRG